MRRPRSLKPVVEKTLAGGKMVFIGGPRQVGKTTLALSLLMSNSTRRLGHDADCAPSAPRLPVAVDAPTPSLTTNCFSTGCAS